MSPRYCKAARALLGWDGLRLAKQAGVSLSTVRDYERNAARPISAASVGKMRSALEAAGVRFIAGGVQISP